MAVNFELITELNALIRRDFVVASIVNVKATDVNPLIDGEFMVMNTSYQLVRALTAGMGWAVFMEKGRYDVQALRKTDILFGGSYEADTTVFTAAGITTIGQGLQIDAAVAAPTGESGIKTGLKIYASGVNIGYVTRLPANNGGKLRFFQTWA